MKLCDRSFLQFNRQKAIGLDVKYFLCVNLFELNTNIVNFYCFDIYFCKYFIYVCKFINL